MTRGTCEKNVHTSIQIVAHLLEAFAHIALDQLGTHEPGQVLFSLNSRVDYTHIAVHSSAENNSAGFQHKGCNGRKGTA